MSQNVTRLKELLFDRETATLAELQQRIAEVATGEKASREAQGKSLETALADEAARRALLAQQVEKLMARAGTQEQFRASVADVLDGAVREAEATRHAELSRAIAPLMIKTIKTELRNSQDEMVEALYPITGRMVKSYVASAMKDLLEQINRRLSGGSSPFMLRLRSVLTGRPAAELALAEAKRLELVDLLLVRRGSGELVEHWPPRPDGAVASNSDIHLSGVLTAINDFAAHALKEDGGGLRSFALDDFEMLIRASPAYLLAAKCRGAAPPGVEAIFDDAMLQLMEQHGKALAERSGSPTNVLPPLARTLDGRLADLYGELRTTSVVSFRPLKIAVTLIALPLLAWGAWVAYTSFETTRTQATAARTVAGMPELVGYPLSIAVGTRGRNVTLTGLTPTSATRTELNRRLKDALPDATINDRLSVLPNFAAELEPQVSNVRREVAGLEAEAVRGMIRRSINRAIALVERAKPQLAALSPGADAATLQPPRFDGEATAVSAELRRLATRLGTGPVDMAQINSLASPLHAVASRLKQNSARLSKLIIGPAATVELSHGEAAPADVLQGAEEISLAAEQFATLTAVAAYSAATKPPPPVQATPRERLERWVKSNAVFFGEGADYRNPDVARATLDTLAQLLRDADVLIRVVGYTDERGGQVRNAPLSQTRAQIVHDALVERGVPRRKLVALGRAAGADISTTVGAQSPNRRVEFEIGFDGEAAAEQ